MPKLISKRGAIEIWHDVKGGEFYVYSGSKLVRVCPSLGMAYEVSAGL